MVKVSELTGALLDYYVAKAEGLNVGPEYSGVLWYEHPYFGRQATAVPEFSSDWTLCGPLIEKYKMFLESYVQEDCYVAGSITADDPMSSVFGDTPLQAICRAVVRAAFGDEVKEVA